MLKTFLTASVISLGTVLAVPVHALSYTWSFTPTFGPMGVNPYVVSGTIDGLQIGSNDGTGIIAIVTNTPTGDLEGTTFDIFNGTLTGGDAFTVDGSGNVTLADVFYTNASGDFLIFGGFGGFEPQLNNSIFNPTWGTPTSSTSFTPITPVPFEFSPALGVGVLGSLWAANKLRKHLTKK